VTGSELLVYVARRLVVLVVLLIVLSFGVFSLLYLAPGSPVDVLLGSAPRSPETVSLLESKYHLDQPFLTQYWLWAREAFQLDFGDSIQTSLPVKDEITARLPTSLLLGAYALALTMVSGVGLGVIAGLRRSSFIDRAVVGSAIVGLSAPTFVVGVLLLWVFAVQLGWFPVFGAGTGFVDQMWHLTLPAVALALGASAYVVKHTRAAVGAVADRDYVEFARARGLSAQRTLVMYVLRNALIPVITISGLAFAFLVTGAVLVEDTFSIPGIGQLLVQSASARDLPMLQGVVMVTATVIVLANLCADVAYAVSDPRVRLSGLSA